MLTQFLIYFSRLFFCTQMFMRPRQFQQVDRAEGGHGLDDGSHFCQCKERVRRVLAYVDLASRLGNGRLDLVSVFIFDLLVDPNDPEVPIQAFLSPEVWLQLGRRGNCSSIRLLATVLALSVIVETLPIPAMARVGFGVGGFGEISGLGWGSLSVY